MEDVYVYVCLCAKERMGDNIQNQKQFPNTPTKPIHPTQTAENRESNVWSQPTSSHPRISGRVFPKPNATKRASELNNSTGTHSYLFSRKITPIPPSLSAEPTPEILPSFLLFLLNPPPSQPPVRSPSPPPMPPGKKQGLVPFLQDLALGGTSGIIAKTACAPLERAKILLQVQSTSSGPSYPNMYRAITGVYSAEGLSGLWRGNLVNCARYFPTQAMNFAFKEKYQRMFVRPRDEVGFARWFAGFLLAGGAAGATALTAAYPLEYCYTRLAADSKAASSTRAGVASATGGGRQFTGLIDCIGKTFATDGLRGLYRGYFPSVAGIVVYRAGYFGLYDFSKAFIMPKITADDHVPIAIAAKFALALGIDIFSALCAYPLDTVRRNMMMMSGRPAAQRPFTSSWGCARYVVAQGGVKGLYKGALTNSVRAVGSALVLVLYDELRHLLLPGTGAGGVAAH